MQIEVSVDIKNGHISKTTVEIPDDDYTVMLDLDYEQRLAKAEKKAEVKRCETVQEVFDLMAKEEYNDWHRENRHRASVPTKDVDGEEVDAFTFIPDTSEEEEREKNEDYDAWCQVIRNALKPKEAEMLIALVLDEITPEEYAELHDSTRDAVYKRSQRSKKKLRSYMLEHWDEMPFQNGHSMPL